MKDTMKKHLLYTVLTFVCAAAVSCTDFLQTESASTKSTESVFETESDVKKALYGVYAAMSHQCVYGQHLSTIYPYNNDIECAYIGASPQDNRYTIWAHKATPSNSETYNTWIYVYRAINLANECVAGIEQSSLLRASSPGEPSEIRQMYGEAKALRALLYLELVRIFGDVPFKTTPTMLNDNEYLEATDRDVILTRLIDDLIEAEPAMYYANQLSESVERMNRGAVQALIARMALTYAGWSLRPNKNAPQDPGHMYRPDDWLDYYRIANTYCKKLYESPEHSHKLGVEFDQVFKNQSQKIAPSDDDMLFEIAFVTGRSGTAVGHYLGERIEKNNYSVNGFSNSWYFVTVPYFHSFDHADKRRNATCSLYYWYWNDATGRLEQKMSTYNKIYISKWSKLDMKTPQGVLSEQNTGINFPILRYADALLMLAETEYELNGVTDAAREALKTVRKRAFDPADHAEKVETYVNGLSSDAFLDAVKQERAWEFAGEAIRKYDLIRWGELRQALIDLREISVEMGAGSRGKVENEYRNTPRYVFWKPKSDGTLDIVVPEQNISSLSGYDRVDITGNLAKDAPGGGFILNNSITYFWREDVLARDPMVYIVPLNTNVIAESGGKLKNYYGHQ